MFFSHLQAFGVFRTEEKRLKMQMLEQQHALDLIELIKRSVATHCVERYRKVSDRVKNLRKKHMNENVIPVLDSNCKLEKSDRRASVNINVGDASFRERDFYNAMRLYNEALCCAHSSKVLARGYSHRSAIYLVWGKYEICLENIREAERYGVSDEEQVKLDDRKRICNEHLAKESGPPPAQPFSSRWKMPAGVYSTAPFIADSVRRLYTKRYGNHILANEDLEVGTVIAMEPAYCSVTMPYVKYLRCSRCTKENWFNLIPCPECPFTMFCSKECQVAAQTEYHDIECAIIGALSTKLSPNNMVAARIAIKLIKQFETAEELKRFIEAKDRRHSDVFRVDYVRSLKDARALYAPIHSLTKSDSDVSRKEVYMHTFATVIVSHLLIKHTVMGKLFQTSEQQEVLMNLLNHLSMVCAMNAQHTTLLSGMTNTDKNDFNEFLFCGWGIHPFSALFNHSCTPNVVFIKDGTTNVIVVSRPIKRDQQLHVCYG